MPIKKENLARYPSDWKKISKQIRNQAGQCCEFCGVPNYAVGFRNEKREFIAHYRFSLKHKSHAEAKKLAMALYSADGIKRTVIVLTVAHLDHVPENCSRDNLRALCQACHLIYDMQHHANTRKQAKFKLQMEMSNV